MNARLIAIANEANEGIGYKFRMEDAKQLHELMEKFAELIVKDAVKVLEASVWNLPRCYKTEDQSELIKDHFGVK